tara:strand:+ start:3687 stop:5315 length:1629 start_codon:yes stop_codon:yes gene_type:complete
MADFRLSLSYGVNHISIPLSFSGDNSNVVMQFDPQLKNSDGEYVYEYINTQGATATNVGGRYEGNLVSLDTTKSYMVSSKLSHVKSFDGSAITEHSLTYKLYNGGNFISFPFTENKLIGEGDYSTSGVADIDFIINKNLLKGSGHATACIDYIKTTGKSAGESKIIQYNGSGSNFPDDWSGNLLEFKAGEGYFLGCSGISQASVPIDANLWSNTANDYNYIPLSGVTPADSEGNNVFAAPYGENLTTSTFTLLYFGDGYKAVDKNNNTLLTSNSSSKITVEGGMTTDYQLVFYPFNKIGLDSNNPLGMACSNLTSKIDTSGVDTGTAVDGSHNIVTIAEDFSGTSSVDDAVLSGGFSPSDVKENKDFTNYPDYFVRGYKQLPAFSAFPNLNTYEVYYRLYLSTWYLWVGGQYMSFDSWRYRAFHSENSPLLEIDPVNFNYQGHKICPVVYNPSESDGERYRFCEYHPHPRDRVTGAYAEDLSEYNHIFYDEEGNRKYSETFGEPYAPPLDKILPYKYPHSGVGEALAPNYKFFKLRGVLKIL